MRIRKKTLKEETVKKIYNNSNSHISSLSSTNFFFKGNNLLDEAILFVVCEVEDKTSQLIMSNGSIHGRKWCVRAIYYLSKRDEIKKWHHFKIEAMHFSWCACTVLIKALYKELFLFYSIEVVHVERQGKGGCSFIGWSDKICHYCESATVARPFFFFLNRNYIERYFKKFYK